MKQNNCEENDSWQQQMTSLLKYYKVRYLIFKFDEIVVRKLYLNS